MAAMNSSVLTFNYSLVASSELTSKLLSPTLPPAISSSPFSTSFVKCAGIRSPQHARVSSDSNISIANNDGRRSALLGLAAVLFTVATATAIVVNKELVTTTSGGASFATAYTVQLPENFTGDKQKVLLSLSREGRSVAAFEIRMTVPDQTPEEADAVVRSDADSLITGVKALKNMPTLELRKETQKMMRKSAAVLKQDLYTIIQGRPGGERSELRRLYTVLFNGVTNLDYAARDNDAVGVGQFSDVVVTTLNEILSRIL